MRNAREETYWPRERHRFFIILGQRADFAFSRVRRAWGLYWSGGFFGILLTERKEEK